MVSVQFCGDTIRVAPGTEDAWAALAAVLAHHGYEVRPGDTDSYNCRIITGGAGKSLHSYGIALDINWTTNPYFDHEGERVSRFSNAASQGARAIDVKQHLADTDMTPSMIADVHAIKTTASSQVFNWGGDWRSVKDCMHFELDVSPVEIAAGIDWTTVVGGSGVSKQPTPTDPSVGLGRGTATRDIHYVIAREGLRRRSTPSKEGDVIGSLSSGAAVNVLSLSSDWALVDIEGDGSADGFIFYSYLSRTRPTAFLPPSTPATMTLHGGGADELSRFTTAVAKAMFPATGVANIEANLPHVLAGLRARGLADHEMGLMALATIRLKPKALFPSPSLRASTIRRIRPSIYMKVRSATRSRATVQSSEYEVTSSSQAAITIR